MLFFFGGGVLFVQPGFEIKVKFTNWQVHCMQINVNNDYERKYQQNYVEIKWIENTELLSIFSYFIFWKFLTT